MACNLEISEEHANPSYWQKERTGLGDGAEKKKRGKVEIK